MGIVLKQSLNNTIVTYIGFVIGAINSLLLYTYFMQANMYGLVQVILSFATVLMPIMAFGVPNSLVKFYSSFTSKKEADGFLTMMLLLPLLILLPLAVLNYFAKDEIGDVLATKNPIVHDYVWHIFLVGMAMAYFEVFYAWTRIQLKSVFGNFMKEVFCRLGQSILLLLFLFKYITIEAFINGLVGFYLLRTVLMKIYAYRLRMPKLIFQLPTNWRQILKYSGLIILGGSTATVLMEVDKVMLNNYLPIEYVAYYGVAAYMALTIVVPSRAMHQITYPMTAKLLNQKELLALKVLYQKSSLTLLIISGILFLLIVLNLKDLYTMLPEGYSKGFLIVFWIGLAKVYDSVLGNNNSILYNSDYYRSILFFGVVLALLAIGFNLWLIPAYGINGAAIASFSAFFIYNTLKLYYVQAKFKMQPFTMETAKVVLLLLLIGISFYFINFNFHPIVNIILKSTAMCICYLFVLYRFKISEDVHGLMSKYLDRFL